MEHKIRYTYSVYILLLFRCLTIVENAQSGSTFSRTSAETSDGKERARGGVGSKVERMQSQSPATLLQYTLTRIRPT